jgi:hypothetical protein
MPNTKEITFSVDCASLTANGNINGTLDSPKGAQHSVDQPWVELFDDDVRRTRAMLPDWAKQGYEDDGLRYPVEVVPGQDIQIRVINRAHPDRYKCAIVRMSVAGLWSNPDGTPDLQHPEAHGKTVMTAPHTPISVPEFNSAFAKRNYSLDYDANTNPTWEGDSMARIEHNVTESHEDRFTPFMGLRGLKPCLLRYYITFRVFRQATDLGYYTFDPFIKIREV